MFMQSKIKFDEKHVFCRNTKKAQIKIRFKQRPKKELKEVFEDRLINYNKDIKFVYHEINPITTIKLCINLPNVVRNDHLQNENNNKVIRKTEDEIESLIQLSSDILESR